MGRGLVSLLAGLLLLAACATPAAEKPPVAPAATAPTIPPEANGAPGVDEIRTSDNMKLVANVPLEAPFDGPESWGTDLAFQDTYAYVGNYDGFMVVDIADPTKPAVVSRTVCFGGQNDISVIGKLLFLSVDSPRSDDTCQGKPADPTAPGTWEGIRIFDISDAAKPKYVTSVRTECGSHTHALVPGDTTVYVYVSSPASVPDPEKCPPPHQNLTIVEVPVENPGAARVVAKPDVFEDRPSGGEDSEFNPAGCHDITVYQERKLAAAACFGDGFLLDITDPLRPKTIQVVQDENFAIWHSATFNNEGTKVVFGDELGGGIAPTCEDSVKENQGANAIYDLTPAPKLEKRGYFKISREQSPAENCVAHNGSLIPVPGKDIMVQGWYQGGVSVWDFTDSDQPREIGFFERGPLPAGQQLGGSWSAYYYNGYIYSSDITKGLDVLEITDPLTDPAKAVKMTILNAQSQRSY
ncbi:hypothetical protein Aph01nite_47320 [Acrocarpospora phusangensis]|uniref:LVIVD repeat-containing protein n=1 Tax=Acrocarpospora phusangensis TaxID=1070424 RepID=A0A919QCI8_9ACTN|nr:hypothetical protein [Acrocarpospora phusangensis]GIH26422.1 hypothetical protein Aph01nite_47320 [Acrocarpospora phusangensis]